jgi:hypothetical protein
MRHRKNRIESPDRDEDEPVVSADFDASDETPMDKFKALARRLLKVPSSDLAAERTRHAAGKANRLSDHPKG